MNVSIVNASDLVGSRRRPARYPLNGSSSDTYSEESHERVAREADRVRRGVVMTLSSLNNLSGDSGAQGF